MNARSGVAALLFGLLFVVTSPALAQPGFAVVDMSEQLTSDALVITYKFNKSVASFVKSQLPYRKVTATSSTSDQVSMETPPPDNMTLRFRIPKSEFNGVDRLEFQVRLINGVGATVFTSQLSSFDLGLFKALTEQLKTANDNAATLNTNLTDVNNKLISANSKLDAAQKSLNTITKGFEPQRVNFVQANLITDGRIVLTFNTGEVPGRIRATIEGPDNFKKTVDSDNISTQHVVPFEGLHSSTEYRVKAVALKLEDRAEIPSSMVDVNTDPRLKITTKSDITPPVASFSVVPAHDKLKVSVTSDQDVFAEITYLPLDANGTPINAERKQIGSIRSDEFGSFTGDKPVAGGTKPTDIVLADLKENTQYKVVLRLVNQIGKTPSQVLEQNPRTAVRPVPFDFTNATNVQMSPTGVKVIWNSTTKAKEARLQVVYDGETTVTINKEAAVQGTEITGNIEVAEVVQMIAKNKVPILRLIMTDGNSPALQRDLQVSFVMPKNSEVKTNTALAEPVRSTLLDVTDKIERGKGVDWKKLLGSGLSMVVRAFLPIPG